MKSWTHQQHYPQPQPHLCSRGVQCAIIAPLQFSQLIRRQLADVDVSFVYGGLGLGLAGCGVWGCWVWGCWGWGVGRVGGWEGWVAEPQSRLISPQSKQASKQASEQASKLHLFDQAARQQGVKQAHDVCTGSPVALQASLLQLMVTVMVVMKMCRLMITIEPPVASRCSIAPSPYQNPSRRHRHLSPILSLNSTPSHPTPHVPGGGRGALNTHLGAAPHCRRIRRALSAIGGPRTPYRLHVHQAQVGASL